jgi:hypothetical protein
VSSPISCIVIKSDHHSKKVPRTGEVVGVKAEKDLFVVMHVDHGRQVAQLMEKTGKHRLFDVSFERLRMFNRSVAEAVHRLLDIKESGAKRRLPT